MNIKNIEFTKKYGMVSIRFEDGSVLEYSNYVCTDGSPRYRYWYGTRYHGCCVPDHEWVWEITGINDDLKKEILDLFTKVDSFNAREVVS